MQVVEDTLRGLNPPLIIPPGDPELPVGGSVGDRSRICKRVKIEHPVPSPCQRDCTRIWVTTLYGYDAEEFIHPQESFFAGVISTFLNDYQSSSGLQAIVSVHVLGYADGLRNRGLSWMDVNRRRPSCSGGKDNELYNDEALARIRACSVRNSIEAALPSDFPIIVSRWTIEAKDIATDGAVGCDIRKVVVEIKTTGGCSCQ